MHTSTDFVLHGGNTEFANRQKLLFDQLSIAEKQCSINKESTGDSMDTEVVESNKSHSIRPGQKRKSETKRYCGKESIFKRPEGPAPRASSRNVPDYHRNPHKWVKYSLDDVSNEDMTDSSNTQAALSFLKELRARRLKEENKDEQMDTDIPESHKKEEIVFKPRKFKSTSQIEFKRPKDVDEELDSPVIIDPDNKPIFKSSKIIMPEYVVGQKQQKRKVKHEKPAVKIDRSKQLKLDHLQEPDEEEED